MKWVLPLGTSVGWLKLGDEIINRSIERNWPGLFRGTYIMRPGKHTPAFPPLHCALQRCKLGMHKSVDVSRGVNRIFALQRRRRANDVATDYRAREMGKDHSLPQVERDPIETYLADLVESSWATGIHGLNFDPIETRKVRFGVGKP